VIDWQTSPADFGDFQMKKTFALQLILALVATGTSSFASYAKHGSDCSEAKECSEAKQQSIPLIKGESLKSDLSNVKLVDALDEKLFARSHVSGSVNIPMGSAAKLAPELLPDKGAKIVVYCMNTKCHASDAVAKDLVGLGYKNVSIYREGLQGAVSSNFPLEGTDPKDPMPLKEASK
jgi:rhodanese-related sulfurtransferase